MCINTRIGSCYNENKNFFFLVEHIFLTYIQNNQYDIDILDQHFADVMVPSYWVFLMNIQSCQLMYIYFYYIPK